MSRRLIRQGHLTHLPDPPPPPGSSSLHSRALIQALVLVHAETVESGFVPPRPFRVNAGPVHSYVLMADQSAKYLSELKPGDAVLGVKHDGSTRAAIVGR